MPVDRFTDPDDAEIAVSIMEWELDHPQKGFDDVIEEVVQDAIDCRAGCAMLDFDPDKGKWGETYWRWKDANLIMFEPGFSDPHHLACGWMQEVRRMKISDIERMGRLKGKAKWYNTTGLKPDGELASPRQGATNPDGSPNLSASDSGDLLGVPGIARDQESVWVLFCWYKDDPTTYTRQGAEDRLIPEGDRYMACDNAECPYRSDTQDELIDQQKLPEGGSLPDTMSPCPDCGDHLSRRDVFSIEEDVLAYPKGRRLVIMPLLQVLADDEPFYDGDWPIPDARSFPMMWVTSYVRPGRPMGPSDTTLGWDAQIASDQLMTMAFDRMMRHQTYYVMDRVGFYDVMGNRFEMRDDQQNVILRDVSNPLAPAPVITMLDGSSLDPAWSSYWQAVQQVLLGHQGINDLGLTPESSKNIAASTVAQLNQIGEIPVAHFKRRKHRAVSKGLGVHWDYIRKTYPKDRLARLNIGDEIIVAKLSGDELANFDFLFTEAPEFSGLEKARTEAFQILFDFATKQPDWLDVFAEINRFPRSVVRKVKRKMAEIEAKASAPQNVGPGPAAAPAGPNPLQLIQASRMNGGGVAPAPEPLAA